MPQARSACSSTTFSSSSIGANLSGVRCAPSLVKRPACTAEVRLLARQIPAPFKPAVASELCTANFDEMWTKQPALDSPGGTPNIGAHDPFVGCVQAGKDLRAHSSGV